MHYVIDHIGEIEKLTLLTGLLLLALMTCVLLFIRNSSLEKTLSITQKSIDNANAKKQASIHKIIQLTQDSENFKDILNHLNFPVWIRRNNHAICYCNPAFSELLDTTREKIIEDQLELSPSAKELALTAIKHQKKQTDRQHIIINNERILFEFAEIPLANKTDTIGFARNIGHIEALEKKLQYDMTAQTELLESSVTAIAIYGSDTKLRFFNTAFKHLWKLDERWLLSKPAYDEILEQLREKRSLPEQVDFQDFKQKNLSYFTNLIEKHEEFYYLPDDRILRVVMIPHAMGGIIVSYEDMTDHIALERSYNTLLSVKESTLNNLHEAIAVYGEDGRLQLSNPGYAHMWHLDPIFLSTEPHFTKVLEETKPLYACDDNWESLKQNMITQMETRTFHTERLERTDGSVIECSYVPLPDGATLFTYLDITDSIQVERSLRIEKNALEEVDRLKTNFLGSVSYELRSPLTSIKGFSEVLHQKYFGELNDRQAEYIQGICDASVSLSALIDNLLDIASIDAGRMVLTAEEFDMYKMGKEITKRLSSKHPITFTCPKTIGNMLGDQKRIKQAIQNILENAIQFTEDTSEIHFTITTNNSQDSGETVTIKIEDHGKGMSANEQEHIFESFYTTNNAQSGIGLGLPIAKSIVEMHGGSILLESSAGVGTTVYCHFLRYNRDLLSQNTSLEQDSLDDAA